LDEGTYYRLTRCDPLEAARNQRLDGEPIFHNGIGGGG
jgi:hypothetical protein